MERPIAEPILMRVGFLMWAALLAMFMLARAQSLESSRAFAFDRGLLDVAEPFAPTGNPALIYQPSYFRFYAEWQRAEVSSYLMALSYPLSVRFGLGLAWSTFQQREALVSPSAAFEVSNMKQTFLLGLGASGRTQWGQQLEVTYAARRASLLTGGPSAAAPFDDDQRIRACYRLGFRQAVTPAVVLGLITPSLITFEYRAFLAGNKPAETSFKFGDPIENDKWMPRLALQWQCAAPVALAFSNRSFDGKEQAQLAAEFRFLQGLSSTAAFTQGPASRMIFGLGSHVNGIDAFGAYETRRGEFRLAVSFAPETAKELLEVQEIVTAAPALYPYRLQHHEPAWLAKIGLRNKTSKPVEVALRLRGHELPTIKRGTTLAPVAQALVEIPVVPELHTLAAGPHLYELEIVAFQRGRQRLQRQFSFEMKDGHDWSGDSRDLNYFVQPHELDILQTARALLPAGRPTASATERAEHFYDFLCRDFRYVPDPRPLRMRQDRVQYATETLRLKSGDCEDLTILMVSLLESVGIAAAFVELAPPGQEEGHVFLLFDSQQSLGEAITGQDNLQRYIVRPEENGNARLFVPLELTKLQRSFLQARSEALALYQKFAMDEHGLAQGWVKIIDTL